MKSAHKIIEAHYGLGRPVTEEEVRSEIENLLRKEKKGNLDDSQQRLMSTLRVAGAMPERDQTQDKATARPLFGVRQDHRTGQYFPQVNGVDASPTSFDETRALEIARQIATKAEGKGQE